MNLAAYRSNLGEKGYVVVRNLLPLEEAQHYIDLLSLRSGISRHDFAAAGEKTTLLGRRGLNRNYNLPDGVAKTPQFWPIITNRKLTELLRQIVDPDIKFLQHNDLHVGFSAISWHRDNIHRQYGLGSDWDESAAPYRLVRVGIYLQSFTESGFRLGFIPGSHRPPENGSIPLARKIKEKRLSWVGAASYLSSSFQEWASQAEWVKTEPGDCIIFDPRVLHSGSYISGPKYSLFVAYGVENQHFYNHFNYYRRIRSELGYQALDPELVGILKRNSLYQSEMPIYDYLPDAWTPPALLKQALARRFKM